MMDLSDLELVEAYRHGDVGALDRLVARHQDALFGYILNMTGNRTEADDVFQDVWLRAMRSVGSYQDRNFGGWLMRIARNLVIDRHRRRKPALSLDQEDSDGRNLAQTLAAPDTPPAGALADRDLGDRIAAAVASLPVEQKDVFVMRVKAGLSFKEIARIQKVSINTALARMQYALSKLRPLLRSEYAELGAES